MLNQKSGWTKLAYNLPHPTFEAQHLNNKGKYVLSQYEDFTQDSNHELA